MRIILIFCIYFSFLVGQEKNAIDYYDKVKTVKTWQNISSVIDSIYKIEKLAKEPNILVLLDNNSQVLSLIDSALDCSIAELKSYEDTKGSKLPHISSSLNYLALSSLSEAELGHSNNMLHSIELMFAISNQVEKAINEKLFFPGYSLALRSIIFQVIEFLLNDPAISTDTLKGLYEIVVSHRIQFDGWEASLDNYEQKQLSEYSYSPPKGWSYHESIGDSIKPKLIELENTQDQIDSAFMNIDSQFLEEYFESVQETLRKQKKVIAKAFKKNYSDEKFNEKLNRHVKLSGFDISLIIIKNIIRVGFTRDVLSMLSPSTSATIMGNFMASNSIPMMENYYIQVSHWDIISLALAARIYELEHHSFPTAINKVVSRDLKPYNKDAFNKFRSYKLMKENRNLIIYSLGKDRINSFGENVLSPISNRFNEKDNNINNQNTDLGIRLIPYY